MKAGGKFVGQCIIHHSMAFHPALSFEGWRHNIHEKMGFPGLTRTGMTGMRM